MPKNLELDKTLKVNDKTYNINAVHSDTTGSTLNSLKITLTDGSNTIKEFNGSGTTEISVVPSTGGEYTGPVKIKDLDVDNNTNDEYITNLRTVRQLVNNVVGLPYGTWTAADSKLDFKVIEGFSGINGAKQKIAVIIGTYSDFNAFCEYTDADKPDNCLYICDDNGNIYFINEEGSQQLGTLAKEADKAKKLETIIDDTAVTIEVSKLLECFKTLEKDCYHCCSYGQYGVDSTAYTKTPEVLLTSDTSNNSIKIGTITPTDSEGVIGDIWIKCKSL